MTSRPSTAAPILAVISILLVMLAGYVGGYFWLGKYYDVTLPASVERSGPDYELRRAYHYGWQASMYRPLAVIETWYRGVVVETNSIRL